MWRGNVFIGNGKADVVVYESNTSTFKEWQGYGKMTGTNSINIGEYDTELGVVIVNHVDLISGNFTFVGSGKPLMEL